MSAGWIRAWVGVTRMIGEAASNLARQPAKSLINENWHFLFEKISASDNGHELVRLNRRTPNTKGDKSAGDFVKTKCLPQQSIRLPINLAIYIKAKSMLNEKKSIIQVQQASKMFFFF